MPVYSKDPFDPAYLALPEADLAQDIAHPTGLQRPKTRKEWFFRPRKIPGSWYEAAAQLPSSAFRAGLALWHLSTIAKANTVKVSGVWLKRFGVPHRSRHRALQTLEAAGLIRVERKRGRCPIVEILPAPNLPPITEEGPNP